jgi:acyl carrier protein
MTREEISALVLEKLLQVAPDIDPNALAPDIPVRDQYDFDSMDFLNYVIALGREFQINIPEQDYPALQSVNGAVDYLIANLEKGSSGE